MNEIYTDGQLPAIISRDSILEKASNSIQIVEKILSERFEVGSSEPIFTNSLSVYEIIVEGVGTDLIYIGKPEAQVFADLGKPDNYDSSDYQYLFYFEKGIAFNLINEKVYCIFYFFSPEKFKKSMLLGDLGDKCKPFKGATDKGINSNSTLEDVLNIYGKPTYLALGEVFSPESSWYEEDWCKYDDRILFYFRKKKLTHIRIM
jgi:hypothetical protein